MSTGPPSPRLFQVYHRQGVVEEATGVHFVCQSPREGSPGRIVPTASDERSAPINFNEHKRVEKHNPFTPFTKKPAAIRTDPVGTPSAYRSPLPQYSPASNGRQFIFRSAGEVRQQHYSDHDSNPGKLQLFDHTRSVAEGAFGTSQTLSRIYQHSSTKQGGAVGYSEILEKHTLVPPGDQSLTPRLNAAPFSDAILARTTAELRQVSTPVKRGRPRKPQLPRPGDKDFVGPLNRRGRKSSGDFIPETGDTAKTARNASNRNLQHLGEFPTLTNGTKAKHGSLGCSHNVYTSEPLLAAVPVLVQLAGGDDAPRKLQIRYRAPNLGTSTSVHNPHCTLEVNCEGMSRRRANALIALFEELVYPFIQSLTSHYRGFHADEDLQTMGLDVALEMLKVTLPDLIRVRRDPTSHQRTVIRRFVKELFCRKIQGFSKESGSVPPTPRDFSCLHLFKAEETPFYDLTHDGVGGHSGPSHSGDVSFADNPDVSPSFGRLQQKLEPPATSVAPTESLATGHPGNLELFGSESLRYDKGIVGTQRRGPTRTGSIDAESSNQLMAGTPTALKKEVKKPLEKLKNSSIEVFDIDGNEMIVDVGAEDSASEMSRDLRDIRTPSHPHVNASAMHEGGPNSSIRQTQQAKSLANSFRPFQARKSAQRSANNLRPAPILDDHRSSLEACSDATRDSRQYSARQESLEATHKSSAMIVRPQESPALFTKRGPAATTNLQRLRISSSVHEAPPQQAYPIATSTTLEQSIKDGTRPLNGVSEPGRILGLSPATNLRVATLEPSTVSVRAAPKVDSAGYPATLGNHLAANFYPDTVFPKTTASKDKPIFDSSLELVSASLGSTCGTVPYPYKPDSKLRAKPKENDLAIKHVDFSNLESQALLATIQEFHGVLNDEECPETVGEKLRRMVRNRNDNDLDAISRLAHSKPEFVSTRKRKAIRKFLTRARTTTTATPSIVRVEKGIREPDVDPNISLLLRHRELGFETKGRRTQQEIRYSAIENVAPVRCWKGASGDIVAAAWSPDSQTYAVGATATANAEDLQYNRPNNFLYGDIIHNTLCELPDHRVPRPRPDTIASGPNSTDAVYDACDPMVYRSVTAIQFSPQGGELYSASHDGTVKVWDIEQGKQVCTETLVHNGHVAALEASARLPRTFATASHTVENPIRVYSHDGSDYSHNYISLESYRSRLKPQHEIYPECLRWGLTPFTEHLLLVGFTRWGDLPDYDPAREGDLCLWDVSTGEKLKATPSAQNIYTAAFHPFLDAFSTGGAPGLRLTHQYTTRSVVRTWDRRNGSSRSMFEYECPALDMQDLVFHPRDPNVLAVGCTDGSIYVWDARNPDHVLHHFEHGEPIADWDHKYGAPPMSREQGDAGVNMTLWGVGKHRLYTGATDGVVKCWDTSRAPEDAFIRDVAQLQAGISCGSFSPDYVSLLVGDSSGGVHVLSSDPGGAGAQQVGPKVGPQAIQYHPAVRNESPPAVTLPGLGPGQLAARELIETGQVVMDFEFGVGQGPAYAGPYAAYAREDGAPGTARLHQDIEKQQPVSSMGRVRENAAARNIRNTIAGRREELVRGTQNSNIVDLTSDTEDVVLDGSGLKLDPAPCVLDEDDMEDDHWFPRMDTELFSLLE